MRVLITGGAGTLGSNLIRHWGPRFGEVSVLDNFATSSISDLSDCDWVKVYEGDVSSAEFVSEVTNDARPDIIAHFAASYKDPDNWIEDSRTNVSGMINVVSAAQQFEVSKIINIQTVLCYGRPDSLPLTENSPLRPATSYAITKVAAENFLAISGLNFVSLRLGSVISPGLSIGPIPNFYNKLRAGETPTVVTSVRDFLDVTDFLSLFDEVMSRPSLNGIFNASTGTGTKMGDLLEIVAEHLGIPVSPIVQAPAEDDVPEIVLDPSKIMESTGWTAKVSLQESVHKCLESYQVAGGTGEVYTHLKASVGSEGK